jgi:Cysteine-rich CPXCG
MASDRPRGYRELMRLPDFDDEFDLDRDFPLGDGTADVGATVQCPYCGAAVDVALDPGSGAAQEYVEDCEVCCQPWRVSVRYHSDGHADVLVTALDE